MQRVLEKRCCVFSENNVNVIVVAHHFVSSFNSVALDRLEQDVKKLKADLQASRQVEQDLRSQLGSLGSAERSIRTELGQLRQENELLQNK